MGSPGRLVNVRIQLVGGPYDGYTWFPHDSLIVSEYHDETRPYWADEYPGLNHVEVEPGASPFGGEFLQGDVVVMKGFLGEAEYWWAEHDRWEWVGLWVWLEEGREWVQEWGSE